MSTKKTPPPTTTSRDGDHADRPGFRNPTNANSKAQKGKRKKKKGKKK